MAFKFNKTNYEISMPPGDTGDLHIDVEWKSGNVDDAAVIFGVVDKNGKDLIVKAGDLADGKAHIRLCNHDTRDLEPGRYKWQLRIVTSPARDENGNVIADECSDNVISVFNGDKMPTFRLEKKGARV